MHTAEVWKYLEYVILALVATACLWITVRLVNFLVWGLMAVVGVLSLIWVLWPRCPWS